MLWIRPWRFCQKRDCRDHESVFHPRNRFFARQWLDQFKNNSLKMLSLRALLSHDSKSHRLSRMSDDAVVDRIAALLISRRLHVHGMRTDAAASSGGQSQDSKASAEPFVPFPISERTRRAPAASPAREPVVDRDSPTFSSSSADFAAQAATLATAAKTGAAACYLCQKR
jgi:hypothetical protein